MDKSEFKDEVDKESADERKLRKQERLNFGEA